MFKTIRSHLPFFRRRPQPAPLTTIVDQLDKYHNNIVDQLLPLHAVVQLADLSDASVLKQLELTSFFMAIFGQVNALYQEVDKLERYIMELDAAVRKSGGAV